MTPTEIKALIDDQITNKTVAYSISNVEVGNLMKQMVDLFADVSPALPKFEIVPFENVPDIIIEWNAERIAKFGDAPHLEIEARDEDGVMRVQKGLEITVDLIDTTTIYHIDLGGDAVTGRVIIK